MSSRHGARSAARAGLALIAGVICAPAGLASESLQPRIGPIVIGQTRAEVDSRLGGSSQVRKADAGVEIRHQGFSIWFSDQGSVARLRSTNPRYCLADKVCPGASIAVVLARLGSPQQGPMVRSGTVTYLLGDRCWAEVVLEGEMVSAVEARCQP